MAGIVQLAPGGTAEAPEGAVSIRLSTTAPAQVMLTGATGEQVEPQFRVSATEVVVVAGTELLIAARSRTGQPFASGTRIGVSLRNPGGAGREVVRPAAEVGGHHSVMLVRLGADGVITDVLADGRRTDEGAWSRSWLRPGAYAYHVHHADSSAADVAWAMVLDASASILVEERRASVGAFLEALTGIAATGFGNLPGSLLLATDPVRDAVGALDVDQIAWGEALGHDPAPWPRVTPAVQRAAEGGRSVALLLDGVPVDYRELTAYAAQSSTPMLVVVVGRSRHGLRPEDRPAQFWDEELAALDGLAALDNVALVSTTDLAVAVENAPALADALFPKVTP